MILRNKWRIRKKDNKKSTIKIRSIKRNNIKIKKKRELKLKNKLKVQKLKITRKKKWIIKKDIKRWENTKKKWEKNGMKKWTKSGNKIWEICLKWWEHQEWIKWEKEEDTWREKDIWKVEEDKWDIDNKIWWTRKLHQHLNNLKDKKWWWWCKENHLSIKSKCQKINLKSFKLELQKIESKIWLNLLNLTNIKLSIVQLYYIILYWLIIYINNVRSK